MNTWCSIKQLTKIPELITALSKYPFENTSLYFQGAKYGQYLLVLNAAVTFSRTAKNVVLKINYNTGVNRGPHHAFYTGVKSALLVQPPVVLF